MRQSESDDRQFWEAVKTIGLLLLAVLFGAFVVSQWMTKLLFQYLINPMLNGMLDRNDGAVVLLSAGLWGAVAALFVAPFSLSQGTLDGTTIDVYQYWFGVTVGGVFWGTAIGVWILAIWWTEAEKYMPVGYDVVELFDTPIDIRRPANVGRDENGHRKAVMPDDDLMEELVLGDGTW